MKGKTRRKIRRFFGIPLTIVGAVFTIGGLFAVSLQHLVSLTAVSLQYFPVWVWLTIFWLIVLGILVLISWILLYIHSKVLTPVIKYFKGISFGKPDENTIKETIDGILNTEKVKPFYVHAAPKSKEMETVYSRLKDIGFAMVSGGPGEGKSMLAYHTAYDFQKKDRYRIYTLETESLENKIGKEIINEVLFQLDNLKGKRKLIIVDDAHKLAIKQDFKTILQQEAEEKHGKYIWVETEYEEEQKVVQLDFIRIDFQSFLGDLLKYLYQRQDSTLQKALEGRIKGLDDAIAGVRSGKIHDAWHFAFVASVGEERLSKEIDQLSPVELLVLFLISTHTVLSWESELSITDLLNKLGNLKFGWLTDALRTTSFRAVIRSLLVEDLLSSTRELLTSEYRKCIYIGVFHRDIGSYAADFESKNKSWLISFVNNLLPEWLQCYPSLLRSIKSADKDIYDEIIRKLDIDGIAEKVSEAKVWQFQQIGYLLNALGDRRDELITDFDLAALAKASASAEVGQFGQLAYLLNALGDRRDELITELDLAALAKATGTAEVGQFEQIAGLLNALRDRRDELITDFDLAALAKASASAEVGQFQQIADLLNALGDRRDELITDFDLAALAKASATAEVGQFEQLRNLLNALRGQRESFIDQLMAEDILNELAGTISIAPPNRFQDIAYLLDSFGSRKIHLIPLLNYDKLIEKANEVSPDDIRGLTSLMARLDDTNRNKLIQEVDWTSLAMMCPIKAVLLRALGGCLEDFCKQAEMLSDKSGFNKIAQYLQNHEDEIIEEIENAYEQVKMQFMSYASLYAGVGKFLWNCNQIDHTLSLKIATKTMSKLIKYFWIDPINYRYAGQLINALYEIDPDSSNFFLIKVQERIQKSINKHDWGQEIEGLKHLIKAFYRSAPDLWRIMVDSNWIVVDLSTLDLDSIYRDVDEEKNAGTAYNTA
jgi:hypothetical protein